MGYKLEGRFRFVHTRLIAHTESVAFFGGDDVEKEVCSERFKLLKDHLDDTAIQTYRFNIFNNFTIRQTPDVVSFALRMYFALQHRVSVAAGSGGNIAAMGEYIQQTVMRTFRSYGDAFDLQETIGNFIGTLENVTDFMYVLEDIASKQDSIERSNIKSSTDGAISFDGVDIVSPGGSCCASDLTFTVKPKQPLIVTGPNASGKSSLFRCLGGLWPIYAGCIRRPCDPATQLVTHNQIFLVPQKPYSVKGSLSDQITYPTKIKAGLRTAEQEARLMRMLSLVQIEYLVDRYASKDGSVSGWDAVMKWEDVLSLGEQQRLGFARLFFNNVQFAVLDECSSAISVDMERLLYKYAHDQGITSITISQRLALAEFHTQELRLGDANGEKGWSLREL